MVSCRCNSRCESVDFLAYGVIESLPVQSLVEGGTDVGAGQPKFDVICSVNHRVLSRVYFSLQSVNENRKETHSDHCENNADGSKNSLGRHNIGDFLCEIQGFDDRIQR